MTEQWRLYQKGIIALIAAPAGVIAGYYMESYLASVVCGIVAGMLLMDIAFRSGTVKLEDGHD